MYLISILKQLEMKPLLRKAKVSVTSDGNGSFDINGYFHEWGNVSYFSETGVTYAVIKGIVELEEGKIEVYDPWRIKFVDEF